MSNKSTILVGSVWVIVPSKGEGLEQGDLLLHYLFVLVADYLERILDKANADGVSKNQDTWIWSWSFLELQFMMMIIFCGADDRWIEKS